MRSSTRRPNTLGGWDLGTPRQWAEVFAEDGVFEMLAIGQTPHLRIEGRAALEAFCAQIRQDWSGLHYMQSPRLRIDGDRAESVIFFEFRHVMRTPTHIRQGVTAGHYRTRYLRTSAGWRIRTNRTGCRRGDAANFYPASLPLPT